jgi:sialidase-1
MLNMKKNIISNTLLHCLMMTIMIVSVKCNQEKSAPRNNYDTAYRSSDVKELIPGVTKIRDIVIYSDTMFYCAFPSVVKLPDGELLTAFRRAPDRAVFGESRNFHVDPNSYLVLVRSKDCLNWSKEPELLYAHPFGGSQDPCMLLLRDGTLLCSSYGWAFVRPDGVQNLRQPYSANNGSIFLGGYLTRSVDNGKSWSSAIYPPSVSSEIYYSALGKKLPACNRGAMCEAKNGRILWAVASTPKEGNTSVYLMISSDKGNTWSFSCPVATDDSVTFNETSLYETPGGDIVAFLRTASFDDQACIARSKDGGSSFLPWEPMGFQGHPLNAIRLPDNRVLLTYGYRHEPYGIRARILNPECTDFKTAPEIVLRDDGGTTDLGYTWPVILDKNHVFVVYYFNKNNGTRYIAGTILEIEN